MAKDEIEEFERKRSFKTTKAKRIDLDDESFESLMTVADHDALSRGKGSSKEHKLMGTDELEKIFDTKR